MMLKLEKINGAAREAAAQLELVVASRGMLLSVT
jgi:hypothetical protein